MDRMIASKSLGSEMVNTLARDAIGMGLNPTLGAIFRFLVTPHNTGP